MVARCPRSQYKDGSCDSGCNNAACNYDGGDCLQTCDLWTEDSDCRLNTWIFDGECNVACNTSECGWDYTDCVDTSTSNDTCNNLNSWQIDYNYSSSVVCYSDWIDDEWCDSYCLELDCENMDETSCDGSLKGGCYSGSDCQQANAIIINLISNLMEPLELITVEEVCEHYTEIAGILGADTNEMNCTQAFDINDLNKNGYIGFWEGIVASAEGWGLYADAHWQQKLLQLDCSNCLDNQSLYWW